MAIISHLSYMAITLIDSLDGVEGQRDY